MIFLIEYDRDRGDIVSIKSFADEERRTAQESRLRLELELNASRTEREVVLLEAASEKALCRTHRRYFENLSQLVHAQS